MRTSRDSSPKHDTIGVADPLVPELPDRPCLDDARPVRSIEEFVEFLASLEAVVGPDKRSRSPTKGGRFLL